MPHNGVDLESRRLQVRSASSGLGAYGTSPREREDDFLEPVKETGIREGEAALQPPDRRYEDPVIAEAWYRAPADDGNDIPCKELDCGELEDEVDSGSMLPGADVEGGYRSLDVCGKNGTQDFESASSKGYLAEDPTGPQAPSKCSNMKGDVVNNPLDDTKLRKTDIEDNRDRHDSSDMLVTALEPSDSDLTKPRGNGEGGGGCSTLVGVSRRSSEALGRDGWGSQYAPGPGPWGNKEIPDVPNLEETEAFITSALADLRQFDAEAAVEYRRANPQIPPPVSIPLAGSNLRASPLLYPALPSDSGVKCRCCCKLSALAFWNREVIGVMAVEPIVPIAITCVSCSTVVERPMRLICGHLICLQCLGENPPSVCTECGTRLVRASPENIDSPRAQFSRGGGPKKPRGRESDGSLSRYPRASIIMSGSRDLTELAQPNGALPPCPEFYTLSDLCRFTPSELEAMAKAREQWIVRSMQQ